MTNIKGTVVRGIGAATLTLKLQMPYFAKIVPEIKDCHLASINLEMEQGLRIFNPDFTTPPIPWAGEPGERFSFLKVGFAYPVGSPHRRAWIYIPHGSPHYYNPFCIEIITEFIRGLSYGAVCQVQIPKLNREAILLVI